MNYEVDSYVEAHKRLPSREITLETKDGEYFFFKADILSGMVTYSTDKNIAANLVTIPAHRAFEVLNMNRVGERPEKLDDSTTNNAIAKPLDLAEQDDLTRFDKRKGGKKKRNKGNKRNDVSKELTEIQTDNSNQPQLDGDIPFKNNKQEKAESQNNKKNGVKDQINAEENQGNSPKNRTDRVEKKSQQEKLEQQNRIEQPQRPIREERHNRPNSQGKGQQNENNGEDSIKSSNNKNHKNNHRKNGESNNQLKSNNVEKNN